MAKPLARYLEELLRAYQERTCKSCTDMALDFEVTLSNLYLYRTGAGNPTAATIDRIIAAVEAACPELLDQIPWH